MSKKKKPNFKIGDHRVTPSGRILVFTGSRWEDTAQMPVTAFKAAERVRRSLRRLGWIVVVKPVFQIFRSIKGVLNV